MISRLLGGVTPWLLAALIGLSVFQYQYTQRVAAERDRAELQAEHAHARAEILKRHQQFQRQQIQTLNAAMAERERTLAEDANDIRASKTALEELGEVDASTRDWINGDRPSAIDDWVRALQRSTGRDAVLQPNDARAPNQ